MAFGEVRLVPGVNTERTPTLNQAGISTGNLIRWREGLVEKIGGWVRFYAFSVGSVVRDLLGWQDINNVDHLAVGATGSLSVITDGALVNITPQTTTTNTPPYFVFTAGSATVTVTDTNITGPTTNNSVFLATPVWGGGIVLSGLYPITANISTSTYQIKAASTASTSTTDSTITMTNANPGVVTWTSHGLSAGTPVFFKTTGALPTNVTPYKTYFVLSSGLTVNNFEFAATPGGTAVNTTAGLQSGTQSCFANAGCVPIFTATSGSSSVNVQEDNHGLIVGSSASFLVSTTVGGTTVSGTYLVQSVQDSNNFTISVTPSASSSAVQLMNSGNVRFVYYIAIGPQSQAQPYGAGPYGTSGAYGIGRAAPAGQGTPITATDWTQTNWGEILLSCPQGGGIYQWSPDSGFETGQLVPNAPIMNNGIFLAMPYQILVAYGSSRTGVPSPLTVRWSSVGDYTDWTPTTTNQAGSYTISSGSTIVGGLQASQQGLLWTDLDLWSMMYVNVPNTFGFSKIMSGCGLIGSHARGILGSSVYWMSQREFFVMPAGGAPTILPCTVWDYIFQNLDTTNAYKIRCAPNSNFGTIAWHFPSLNGSGENDLYVEYNVVEREWTTGQFPSTGRSAWMDQSVFGAPIGGTPTGLIYQHEQGYDGDGVALNPTFTTGYFVISPGEEYCFLDQFIPDFKYGTYGGSQNANPIITLRSIDYPAQTPRVYGPYSVTAATNLINTRLRGRQVSLQVQSQDAGSFWRIGLSRYRYAPDGRR